MSACILAPGALTSHGYGRFQSSGVVHAAHRAAYESAHGPIPKGMVVDHLCRNRACVNVDHLELVTPRENTLRGVGITAKAARATHCPAGHSYDESNTYVTPKGHRDCRECRRAAGRRRNARAAIAKATGAQP